MLSEYLAVDSRFAYATQCVLGLLSLSKFTMLHLRGRDFLGKSSRINAIPYTTFSVERTIRSIVTIYRSYFPIFFFNFSIWFLLPFQIAFAPKVIDSIARLRRYASFSCFCAVYASFTAFATTAAPPISAPTTDNAGKQERGMPLRFAFSPCQLLFQLL